jgi:hypothetical protein
VSERIVIPRWEDFQHYGNRDPVWIKNHTRLLSKDEYLELTFHQRGVLHGLWMEYARARRQLTGSTSAISRRLGGRVTRATLEALNHAGFVDILASELLAERYHDASLEEKREEKELRPQEPKGPKGPALHLVKDEESIDGLERLGTSPAFREVLDDIKRRAQ